MASLQIADDVTRQIKALGAVAVKRTMLHAHFGIVVGAALTCDRCGNIRMRFDECLHMAPLLACGVGVAHSSSAAIDCAVAVGEEDEGRGVVAKVTTMARTDEEADADAGKKLSKHQMKKQKRVEVR